MRHRRLAGSRVVKFSFLASSRNLAVVDGNFPGERCLLGNWQEPRLRALRFGFRWGSFRLSRLAGSCV
jgi:hypothetical protein